MVHRVKLGEKEDTTAIITEFDLLKVIGKGTFGKVGQLGAYQNLLCLGCACASEAYCM